MRITNIETTPLVERPHARGGVMRFWPLMEGDEGNAGNFLMILSKTYSDFDSPRHRHNFEQFRFQVEGDAGFDRDGVMKPGCLGYFPEGTHYGPQTVADESLTLVLQFGGPSGHGYMSEAQFQRGVDELKKTGTFERGIYSTTREDGRKKNKDAYEAVWEHVNQRALNYPENRYTRPVFMNSDAFQWLPAEGEPGVSRKQLGVFSERLTTATMTRLEAGAGASFAPNTLLFVVSGEGEAEGRGWSRHSAMYTEGRHAAVRATAAAEILAIELPRL